MNVEGTFSFRTQISVERKRRQETEKNHPELVQLQQQKGRGFFFCFTLSRYFFFQPTLQSDDQINDTLRWSLIFNFENIRCPLCVCLSDPSSASHEKHTNTRPRCLFVSSQKLVNYDSTLCLNEPRGLSIWFHSFNPSLPQPIPFFFCFLFNLFYLSLSLSTPLRTQSFSFVSQVLKFSLLPLAFYSAHPLLSVYRNPLSFLFFVSRNFLSLLAFSTAVRHYIAPLICQFISFPYCLISLPLALLSFQCAHHFSIFMHP